MATCQFQFVNRSLCKLRISAGGSTGVARTFQPILFDTQKIATIMSLIKSSQLLWEMLCGCDFLLLLPSFVHGKREKRGYSDIFSSLLQTDHNVLRQMLMIFSSLQDITTINKNITLCHRGMQVLVVWIGGN
jgi:hypothetical protein